MIKSSWFYHYFWLKYKYLLKTLTKNIFLFYFLTIENMKKLNKGFTLVELIVVITILAVLATIAFITLGDYPTQSRDSKRESDIANIAKKISIITSDGTIKHKELVGDGNASAQTAGTYKVYSGDINFKKLKESPEAFKAPLENEKYQIVVVNDANDSNVCYEVAAKREQTAKWASNLKTVKWTCNPTVTEETALADHLYSKNKVDTTLRAN